MVRPAHERLAWPCSLHSYELKAGFSYSYLPARAVLVGFWILGDTVVLPRGDFGKDLYFFRRFPCASHLLSLTLPLGPWWEEDQYPSSLFLGGQDLISPGWPQTCDLNLLIPRITNTPYPLPPVYATLGIKPTTSCTLGKDSANQTIDLANYLLFSK